VGDSAVWLDADAFIWILAHCQSWPFSRSFPRFVDWQSAADRAGCEWPAVSGFFGIWLWMTVEKLSFGFWAISSVIRRSKVV
jgi:hypothetical protein